MPRRSWIAPLVVVLALVAGSAARLRAQGAPSRDQQKLLARADQIAHKVAALRGLSLRHPIVRGVMSKPQITRRLLARVHQEYKPGEIQAEELAMKRLGLLPLDADYLKLVIKLLSDQVAGFYDPWEKELYVADWNVMGGDMLMAHEIDHALQDQHFDLKKWLGVDRDNADAMLARQALVEGDGTALMIEYTAADAGGQVPWAQDGFVDRLGPMMSMQLAQLKNTPLVLREGLVFPYLAGLKFVVHFRKTRPWSAVDAVYNKPPLLTEQILHPALYDSYQRPVTVRAVAAGPLAGYHQAYDNVEGEMALSVLLRQHGVDKAEAAEAAAGWGGDRIAVYTAPGFPDSVVTSMAVLYTVWDEVADADEFFTALEKALPSLSRHGSERARRDGYLEYRTPAGAVVSIEKRDDRVLLIVGALPGQSDGVRTAVWKSWNVRRP